MSVGHFLEHMKPQLIEWRRKLHQHPELGFMEYETTAFIAKQLEDLGFKIYIGKDALKSESRYGVPACEELKKQEQSAKAAGVPDHLMNLMKGGHTGLAALWDTEREGKHSAFRFDIDALPIEEAESEVHLPFKHSFSSQRKGVMHACGHDGHTSIGLGLAHYIFENHKHLNGTFTLLFQPAEEGGRGAKAMTDKGWLKEADHFYSGHIGIQQLPVGTIAASTRGFLASSKLNATFKGQSSHAGMKPEDGRNALLAAATAATQLYTIPRHSEGVSRVNVGKLAAGNGRNIISDKGYLELETRGETQAINQFMQQQAKRIIQSAADMHNVEALVEFVGETEEMVCDESLISSIQSACKESLFVQRVEPSAQVSGSEDASFMINEVQSHGGQATYMLFGTPLPANHHAPLFDFDEGVLTTALETYIQIVKGGHSVA
ncbi:amidohydrolase [Halobacillus sp. Marseille-Q1614]|uniref:amidohydrolase n=1 Tax=Halobacillus sp. Marseille-Q1614 TaxID=2709134 RepID=UPI00156D6B30|nr:amidohydrolase [Halobacillus sp. Marseille-Q1614]